MNSKSVQWQALEGLGALAFNDGNFEKAVEYFKQALTLLTASTNTTVGCLVLFESDEFAVNLLSFRHIRHRNVLSQSLLTLFKLKCLPGNARDPLSR